MVKMKRKVIGSVVKGKEGKNDYIKVRGTHVLKDGQFLNLESKATQLKRLDEAVAAKKLTPDLAATIKARINKIPDFVRFEVITLEEE